MQNELLQKYSYSYSELNESTKKHLKTKRFFVGSNDLLGYYEPSLIDRIIDDLSRKGRFTNKEPKSGCYFCYWYDINNNLLKIKYICTDNDNENYDIFPVTTKNRKLFLFYDLQNLEDKIKLSSYYILDYNENNQLIRVNKNIARALGTIRELEEEKYEYINDRITSAYSCSSFSERDFTFYYGVDGYLESYESCNPSNINSQIYRINVKKSDILAFEKFGLYHFSPLPLQ